MTYLTVKDLKQTRKVWNQLKDEREIIITRDGKPCAVLVEVDSDSCEDALKEIRRAFFSSAVSRIRNHSFKTPISEVKILTPSDFIQSLKPEQ